MPTYTTKIHLQDANERDYSILNAELSQRSFATSFRSNKSSTSSSQGRSPVDFIRQGNVIQEVIDDIIYAAQKTGKKFSFTVIKNKN